jgi:hypothetical protein
MIFPFRGSYGLKESYVDQKRQKQRKFLIFVFRYAFLSLFCYGFYTLGTHQKAYDYAKIQSLLIQEQNKFPGLTKQVEELELKLEKIVAEKNVWKDKYASDVPQGSIRPIFALLSEKLKEGITPERFTYVLENIKNTAPCSSQKITKQLSVLTKLHKSALPMHLFEPGIYIEAEGKTTKNRQGQTEAWFDPSEPISLMLTDENKKNKKTLSGKLPFEQKVVFGHHEYRLSITNSTKGLIQVTGQICAFP